ncbi:hypothetical protein [Caulobacter sp. LARHSG274]
MLRFTKQQSQAPLLFDRQALILDVEEHLAERFPQMTAEVPRGYLWALINESIRIALWMRIYDVEHIRFFCALRWEFAPGFYREPRLWKVLVDFARSEAERMDALGEPRMEDAWQAAIAARSVDHWDDQPETLAP